MDAPGWETWMEEVIESFERDWVCGEAPNVLQRLEEGRRRAGKPAVAGQLALELALVDLEFRWRGGVHGRTRKTAWYRLALRLSDEAVEQLAWHELLVRSCWGDKPSVEAVVEQLPTAEHLRAKLHHLLQRRFPVAVHVRSDHADQSLNVPLIGQVVVGRQRRSDQAPLSARTVGTEGGLPATRVIVADQLDSSMSRNQLIVRRWSVDLLELEVAQRGTPVMMDDHRLKSEQRHRVRLGAEIGLKGYRISLNAEW